MKKNIFKKSKSKTNINNEISTCYVAGSNHLANLDLTNPNQVVGAAIREGEEAVGILLTAIKIRISQLPKKETNKAFMEWVDGCADVYSCGSKVRLDNPEQGYVRELSNLHASLR
jgi:dTDP-4-dehydrorhamnose reductase